MCSQYGFVMGATTLLSFVIVIYGKNDGSLGEECNREVNNSCDAVFRARSTVFATLTWQISRETLHYTSK